jgi:hypothetical protein
MGKRAAHRLMFLRLFGDMVVLICIVVCTRCESFDAGQAGQATSSTRPERRPQDLLPPTMTFTNEPESPEPEDPLLRLLWKYSPDAFYLFQRCAGIPSVIQLGSAPPPGLLSGVETGSQSGQYTFDQWWRQWITAREYFDQVEDLPTAVHETNHLYTSAYAMLRLKQVMRSFQDLLVWSPDHKRLDAVQFHAHYLDRIRTLFINVYDTFPTREIAERIPVNMRTDRYKLYVTGTSSTQSEGIFGLLDEYHAYYWSLRTAYDLYDYYRLELPQTAATWLAYTRAQAGDFPSWSEFRYWILTYLLFARDVHPRVYEQVLHDERFRTAFTEIDDLFIDLQKRVIHRVFDELPLNLKSIGLNCYIQTGKMKNLAGLERTDYFLVITDSSGRGLGNGMNWGEYSILLGEQNTPLYLEMAAALRIRQSPQLPPLAPEQP